jgi:hypothetical protein
MRISPTRNGVPGGIRHHAHDTLMVPLLLSAIAETPVGTAGGTQTGLAETSLELAEAHLPLLALTT